MNYLAGDVEEPTVHSVVLGERLDQGDVFTGIQRYWWVFTTPGDKQGQREGGIDKERETDWINAAHLE